MFRNWQSVRRRSIAVAVTLGVPAGLAVAGVADNSARLLIAAVIAGLVSIPVTLRIIRGPVAMSEMRFLARVQLRQEHRSRRLKKALRTKRLMLDKDEEIVLELRRHPATMVSPVLIFSLVAASAQGLGTVLMFIGAVLKFAVSSWQGLLVTAAVVGGLVYFTQTHPTAVFVTLVIVLALVVIITAVVLTLWIRYWMLQTYVFTTTHLVIFPNRKKLPVKIPLPHKLEEVVVDEPGNAKSASRFRLALLPWGNVVLYRTTGAGHSLRVAVLTGVPGAALLKQEGLFTGTFPPPVNP